MTHKIYAVTPGPDGSYRINDKTYEHGSMGWRLIVQVKDMENNLPRQTVLKFIYDNFDDDLINENNGL